MAKAIEAFVLNSQWMTQYLGSHRRLRTYLRIPNGLRIHWSTAVRDRWSSGGPAEEKSCDRWPPLAFGVRAFSALPRHFLRSWTTDEASSGTEDSSSQKVSPGLGSSYRHPPRAEMPSGPVLMPSTPPFPPLVLRCSSGRTAGALAA